MKTLSERVNQTLFKMFSQKGMNGRTIQYSRGNATKELIACLLSGQTEAEMTRNEVELSVLRSFVIERKALSVFFPPQPNDLILWNESGGTRKFAIRSQKGAVFWSYWNNDSRYIKIETKEVKQ